MDGGDQVNSIELLKVRGSRAVLPSPEPHPHSTWVFACAVQWIRWIEISNDAPLTSLLTALIEGGHNVDAILAGMLMQVF